MAEINRGSLRQFWLCARTACSHTVLTLFRNKRTVLAACAALAPVILPLAMVFLSRATYSPDGNEAFVRMVELIHLRAIAPLLALFFGCMLIGEEIELETMPYLLTRPIPRPALVFGKFVGYGIVTVPIATCSILLTFGACVALGGFSFSAQTVELVAHYCGVMAAALLSYGALCTLLGAWVRRPVIISVVILFGWQRIAMQVPGVVDFLTIEKYVNTLLPRLAREREREVIRTVLMEYQKKEFLVGAFKALLVLVLISAILLWLTAVVIQRREYSKARAVQG